MAQALNMSNAEMLSLLVRRPGKLSRQQIAILAAAGLVIARPFVTDVTPAGWALLGVA